MRRKKGKKRKGEPRVIIMKCYAYESDLWTLKAVLFLHLIFRNFISNLLIKKNTYSDWLTDLHNDFFSFHNSQHIFYTAKLCNKKNVDRHS